MMLTTDLALGEDPDYKPISTQYASDLETLERDFMHAWYRLTTGDMGTPDRCIGDMVPDAQWWQHPLPAAPTSKPNYVPIRAAVQAKIDEDASNIGALSMLAYNCAMTFRETDYRGGCNGVRIRFSPEKDWAENEGTDAAIGILESIQTDYPDISMSDLIVLAGQTAIEAAGGDAMNFCGGRVDASDASG